MSVSAIASVIMVLLLQLTSSKAFIVISRGKCPNVPVEQNFDINRYLGNWYSYENFDAPFQIGATCISARYSLLPNGDIGVLNYGYREFKLFGRTIYRSPTNIEGSARVVDPAEPAALAVSFPGSPTSSSGDGRANYLIVDTDYLNYSVVYSCTQPTFLPFRIEFAWILTRQRGRRPDNIAALKANLRNYGINTRNFKPVDHSNC